MMTQIVIHEAISLGTFCFSAHFLRKYALRLCAYPFDWVFSDPGIITECFMDQCQQLLNQQHYTEYQDTGKCQHTLYDPKQLPLLHEHPSPPFFYHHNPLNESHYQHYLRAVTRLHQLLSRDSHKLFLITYSCRSTPIAPIKDRDRTGQTGHEVITQLYQLKKTIDDRTKNAFLMVINCLEKKAGQASSVINCLQLYNEIIIVNLYTSRIMGTEFIETDDWELYKNQIDAIFTFDLVQCQLPEAQCQLPENQCQYDPF